MRRTTACLLAALVLLIATRPVVGAEPKSTQPDAADNPIVGFIGGFFNFDELVEIGVTRDGEKLMAVVNTSDSYDLKQPRVLVVFRGDSDVDPEKLTDAVLENKQIMWSMLSLKSDVEDQPTVGRVENNSGGNPSRGYPPKGPFYSSPTDPEAQYVWRWIGMHAPDLVVEVAHGAGETWYVPESDLPQLSELKSKLPNPKALPENDELTPQLVRNLVCDVGRIPAVRVVTNSESYFVTLQKALGEMKLPPSPARLEIQRRLARSPREIADELLAVYGKQLSSPAYIPALAVVGRLRHDRIVGGEKSPISPVALAAVEPYVAGKKAAHDPKKPNGSINAGHLVFAELATMTGDERYTKLVKSIADLAFDADGKPLAAMPSHSEMSDAVFMGCPILAEAGKLTGDAKYFEACARHAQFMQKLCLRTDGIYRHSPLDETAWGRGNGFPALGLAWTLDALPESFAGRKAIAESFRKHLQSLLKHQDVTGCWHQVIDHHESYREFTATAMIAYAMMRGVQTGVLDRKKFDPAIRKAWNAIKVRIGSDGGLVDVCTGTGKQKSLREYYDRGAILGRDDRGGAMALMIATEMERYDAK